MQPTEILARRSIGEFQRIITGKETKKTSVRVLIAAKEVMLASDGSYWVIARHTLLVDYEQVDFYRSTIMDQLFHEVFIQVWSASKEAVEVCGDC